MVILALQFICVVCGLKLERPTPLQVAALPVKVDGLIVPPPPPGWTLTQESHAHCPDHPPRLVEPVTVVPNLQPISGGRR